MSKLPIKPSLPNDRRSNAVGRLRDIRAAADMITPVHTNNLRERAETLYEESLRHRIRDYDRQSRQFKKRMKNSAGYISASRDFMVNSEEIRVRGQLINQEKTRMREISNIKVSILDLNVDVISSDPTERR